jgi:hypothetical protein
LARADLQNLWKALGEREPVQTQLKKSDLFRAGFAAWPNFFPKLFLAGKIKGLRREKNLDLFFSFLPPDFAPNETQ